MLHKETISSKTLELLKIFSKDPLLSGFFLVGGTALALQIGHRLSLDIDFFTRNSFDENSLLQSLEQKYNMILDFQTRNTLKGEIDGIKIDLITHDYPLVKKMVVSEEIRLSSIEDISAMKLNAIIGNGTRLKDFVDVACLSPYLTLSEMMNSYEKKYSTRNPTMILKSLNYYNDINFEEEIKMVNGRFQWKIMENRLSLMTKLPNKLFAPFY